MVQITNGHSRTAGVGARGVRSEAVVGGVEEGGDWGGGYHGFHVLVAELGGAGGVGTRGQGDFVLGLADAGGSGGVGAGVCAFVRVGGLCGLAPAADN